jgi:flagellar biosynthesis protein FliQ
LGKEASLVDLLSEVFKRLVAISGPLLVIEIAIELVSCDGAVGCVKVHEQRMGRDIGVPKIIVVLLVDIGVRDSLD